MEQAWIRRGIALGVTVLALLALWQSMRVSVDVSLVPAPEPPSARVAPPVPASSPIPRSIEQPEPPTPAPEPMVARLAGPNPFEQRISEQIERGDPVRWEPLVWPPLEQVPPVMRPDSFRSTIERLARECDLGSELLSVDCAEPPCFGIFAGGGSFDPGRAAACRAWHEVFGGSIQSSNLVVPCSSGKMKIHIVTPSHLIADTLGGGLSHMDSAYRLHPRFGDSLDLEELCRIHEESVQ
jgi:hypothetical protein